MAQSKLCVNVIYEEVLVKLFEEELRFHQPYTPFVHVSPNVISAFRSRLARLWAGETLEDGAPQVVVVEQDNRVVAMAENDLLFIKYVRICPILLHKLLMKGTFHEQLM